MSIRIHFRPIEDGRNIEYLKPQIEELTGFMFYNDVNNEITTFTKVSNDSFYEVGSDYLYGLNRKFVKSSWLQIGSYPDGSPIGADVIEPQDIQNYLDKYSDKINELLSQDFDYWKLTNSKQLIKVLQFAVDNELAIWNH